MSPIPDSQSAATDALSWKGMVGICIPYNSPSDESVEIIISDQCKIMLIAPALPTANWFQVVLGLLIEEPVVLPVTTNMLKQTRAEILYANPFCHGSRSNKGFFRKRLQNASQSQFEDLQVQCKRLQMEHILCLVSVKDN